MAARNRFLRSEVLANLQSGTHARGTNAAVGATNEALWSGGSVYNLAIAAGAQKISSSATADDGDPVGTGARTVQVTGISGGALTSETVTMNGRTQVTLANTYTRFLQARVLTVGSGGVNAGDIYVHTGAVTNGVPDTATEVYLKIPLGEGQSSLALVQTPTGLRGYVLRWWASASVVRDYNGTPDFVWDEGSVHLQLVQRNATSGLVTLLAEAFLSDAAGFQPAPFDLPFAIPAGEEVYILAKTVGTSATPPVTGGIEVGFGPA